MILLLHFRLLLHYLSRHPGRRLIYVMLIFLMPLMTACSTGNDQRRESLDYLQEWLREQARQEFGAGPNLRTEMGTTAVAQIGEDDAEVPPTPLLHSALQIDVTDWPVTDGHFFRYFTDSPVYAGKIVGYTVTNTENAPFYDAFRALGGETIIGPPRTQRFILNGRLTQVFRDVVLQLNDQTGHVEPMNLLDVMSGVGLDEWLRAEYGVPPPLESSFDSGRTWEEIAKKRLDLLNQRPAMRARYFGMNDPLPMLGLPGSQPTEMGDSIALRFQRGVMHEWIRDTSENRAGNVTIVTAGEILLGLGIVPEAASTPEIVKGTIVYADASPSRQHTSPPSPSGRITNVGRDRLRLRHSPEGETVALLTDGEPLELLSQQNILGWVRIRTAMGTGWVLQQYIQVEQAPPTEESQTR
jgi:hypothetical protein